MKLRKMSTKVSVRSLPRNFYVITILSRLVIIILQILFNHLVTDHQSDAFKSPYELISSNQSVLDSVVNFTFDGFSRWDAQYFLHIATLGYTHENSLAFFPLFPIFVKFQTFILQNLININDWNASLILSICTNSLLFTFSSKFLFLVTVKLTSDRAFANRTWMLFCLSPLTIFFVAPYSEAMFCFFTFGGIYYCLEEQYIMGSLFFGFSSATRSNGLMNIGFIGFYFLAIVSKSKLRNIPILSLKFSCLSVVSIFPFMFFQWYAYQEFCHVHDVNLPKNVKSFLKSQNLVISGSKIPEWCHQTLPVSYSAVQSTYWNVGFLHYFQLKQIPNFLLAAPIILLVGLYSFMFFKGIFTASVKDTASPLIGWQFLPFVVHSSFLALFSFFIAHVQISTRLLGSSSPTVYWIMAWLTESNLRNGEEWDAWFKLWKLPGKKSGKIVCFYCVFYVLVGSLLFVNHLPWT